MASGMCNCVTNTDYVLASSRQAAAIVSQAKSDTAIAVALAGFQQVVTRSIADMQDEIAQRQIALAEAVHAHAKMFYVQEANLLTDVFSTPKATPEYALRLQWRESVDGGFTASEAEWGDYVQGECTAVLGSDVRRFQNERALAVADVFSFAARQAEGRADALNDGRYEKQLRALGLRHGDFQGLRNAQRLASNLAGFLTDSVTATSSSALEAYGYFRQGRQNPQWGHGSEVRASMTGVAFAPTIRQRQVVSEDASVPWRQGIMADLMGGRN